MVKVITDKVAVDGLGRIWIGKVNVNTTEETAYDLESIISMENVKNFAIEEEQSIEKDYASNKVFKKQQIKSGASFSLELANYPKELIELIEGAEVDEDGTFIYRDTDVTPEVGVLYETTLDNGELAYVAATNVVINRASDSVATKEDGANFQPITLEGEAFAREFDGVKKIKGSIAYNEDFVFDKFFEKVFKNETKGEEGEETP